MTTELLHADGLRTTLEVFRDLLQSHQQFVNRLNVYPVPDGDTGTNMALTVTSVCEELSAASPDLDAVCTAISHGSLMGARGNSGVILSQ
ncbi:MAG TPA: DAK2 domain-containing protein, partial [Acidimicrobiales bacterium]|nr:DAK2 domain-containing protein [Acidimicrobiales bacterium]